MIALFFATLVECQLIIENLKNKKTHSFKNIPVFRGKIDNQEILLCISGIGKINSSIASILAFENFPINKAIISGIAGAYPASGLNIGDMAVAEKEIEADQGLLINCDEDEDSFIFMDFQEFPLYVPNSLQNFKKGIFLTVSACTGNLKRAKFLERKFNAICENMEGAAIAKVAQNYGVPVTEIRSISNLVTDRNNLLKTEEVIKAAEIVQRFILESFHLFE
ncbi:MAG: futalosine hydrolase [Thermodesulfovibrio sp.]|nr:futalosine hydrolase [Thermodesulfovibrio sp.]